jgi:RNA polymerase sigma-70 factor, ECF subfamily
VAQDVLLSMTMPLSHRRSDDAVLVRRAQEDDPRAFDELARRYQDRVYRLCCGILRHEDDAAEALQDAFLSAYRGLKSFKAESTFSTWLYRIATNASLMKYRRRRDNHVSLDQSQGADEEAEPMQLPDRSAQPLESLLAAESREVMAESIRRLPEELRAVFVLRDLEGLSNNEVGEALRLSVPAVKSRLHRGRRFLRDHMAGYFDDRPTRRSPGRAAQASGWPMETAGQSA